MAKDFIFMATIQEQNKLRVQMGMAPLPETEGEAKVENKVADTTTNSKIDNTQIEVKKEDSKAPEVKKEPLEEKKVAPIEAELTPEQVLAYLKKKGMDISSLDEIGTKKETAEQIAEKRNSAKLAYAFSKGLITQSRFQSFSADNADINSLVYRQYLQEQKKEDPALSDAEIHQEFQDKYGLSEDATPRQKKRGQAELNVLGNQILRETYKEVYNIDEVYNKYEAQENTRTAEETKLIAETPKYKAHIDNLFEKTLNKFSVKVKIGQEDHSFDLQVPAETLSLVKNSLLKTETAIDNIKAGLSQEALTHTARMLVLDASISQLVGDAVNQALLKKAAGVKGIVPDNNSHVEIKEPTEAQKELRARMGMTVANQN